MKLIVHQHIIAITSPPIMSIPNEFDFDITQIPGDGTCFYHMLSVAISGNITGDAIRADVHSRWNNMNDIYHHIHSEYAFNKYLVNYVSCHLGESREATWNLLRTNKRELFRLAGEHMFGGHTYADEFAINIIAMLYRVEVNVLVVTEQASGKLLVSDTRKFPYDQTAEQKYGNFKNWSATKSIATALYNAGFYVNSNTINSARYPNHFTNIYHTTKTYADALSGRADAVTRTTTKLPGGWEALLDGARQSLLRWITHRYIHCICNLMSSWTNQTFKYNDSKIMAQSRENKRRIQTARYVFTYVIKRIDHVYFYHNMIGSRFLLANGVPADQVLKECVEVPSSVR